MTNKELRDKLIDEANALAQKANDLLMLSRKIDPNFLSERELYLNDIDADRSLIDDLYDRVLMYIDYSDAVSAKDITERFDFPTDYPSQDDKTMFSHVLLNRLIERGDLIKNSSEKEFTFSTSTQGKENARLRRLIENHPGWSELYF
jgi:hypothetical protein